ncbi:MAG: hypothetical protein NTW65_05165 [Deltaproteobacteria bacterium]|nr:hypothetical protein [Deltaproteobacteria bacterium]
MFAVLAAFVMLPFTSFAKAPISESEMAGITAQVGVTINFDQFSLGAVKIDAQSWGDSDGFTGTAGYTAAGWVGATIDSTTNFVTISGDLTIDVGSSGTVTAIGIGLPTIALAGSMTQVLKLSQSDNLASAGILGTSFMSGVSLTPKGTLIIHAH